MNIWTSGQNMSTDSAIMAHSNNQSNHLNETWGNSQIITYCENMNMYF